MGSDLDAPLRFAFGIHLHQPVGNFDFVFEDHVREVYVPLLAALAEREFLPITVHVSGPLLEWLERNDHALLDLVGSLAGDGRVELLASGLYEPVLVALPRADRVVQVQWMRDRLRQLFGVEARGAWLTERVWEQELAEDLSRAGIEYTLLDDRHFLVCGLDRARLHHPLVTESDGRRLALFSIDEKLRYLIPFRPPYETVRYLREVRAAGQPLAVLVDDGEKFGGWPGTKEWVYEQGWLGRFLDAMETLVNAGELRPVTFSGALAEVESGGPVYPPSGSYREMEEWSLPTPASVRLERLQKELGSERLAGPDGALVRGAHWRNFFVRYPEANLMHKKMTSLSILCRDRGDPAEARLAIGRGQCNDAYWHGVFGGLYLPHLRQAVWRQLAIAESILRAKEDLGSECLDIDADGLEEVWIHGPRFSAIVAPHRGAALEEFTVFADCANYADVLTRRLESYHLRALEARDSGGYRDSATSGLFSPSAPGPVDEREAPSPHAGRMPPSAPEERVASLGREASPGREASLESIHEQRDRIVLRTPPPIDRERRALFVDRFLPADLAAEPYGRGEYFPLLSLAGLSSTYRVSRSRDRVDLSCRFTSSSYGGGRRGTESPWWIEKRYAFDAAGRLSVDYRWNAHAFPPDAVFAPELSLARPAELLFSPDTDAWRWSIDTLTQSERGLEWTRQGESVTPRWPAPAGAARIELVPGPGEAE
jgi:hypothetical protein